MLEEYNERGEDKLDQLLQRAVTETLRPPLLALLPVKIYLIELLYSIQGGRVRIVPRPQTGFAWLCERSGRNLRAILEHDE